MSGTFTTACRRSEIRALSVEDLTFSDWGVDVNIRRSKSDQEGEGRTVGVERQFGRTRAVVALEAWLKRASIAQARFSAACGARARTR